MKKEERRAPEGGGNKIIDDDRRVVKPDCAGSVAGSKRIRVSKRCRLSAAAGGRATTTTKQGKGPLNCTVVSGPRVGALIDWIS